MGYAITLTVFTFYPAGRQAIETHGRGVPSLDGVAVSPEEPRPKLITDSPATGHRPQAAEHTKWD